MSRFLSGVRYDDVRVAAFTGSSHDRDHRTLLQYPEAERVAKGANRRDRQTYHVGNLGPLLLREARAALEDAGSTRLTLRAVCDRLGVSAAAAYHHYASRTALLERLAAQGFTELTAAINRRVRGITPGQRFPAAGYAYMDFARRNPALYQLMFGPELGATTASAELRTGREAAFAALRRAIADDLGLEIESAGVRDAALAAWSLGHGLATLIIHGVLNPRESTSGGQLMQRALGGLEQLFRVQRSTERS
jgi:AcrR family transcriptional regulator